MSLENKSLLGKVECLGTDRNFFEKKLGDTYGEENWGYGWLVDIYNQENDRFEPVLLDR